jgi:type VI secretion system protein ImpD
VLDISWPEICRDMESAVEYDQSTLFHLIYSQEFGMPGGVPFSVLIGDYRIRHSSRSRTDDISALKGLTQIAAAAFAPFICNAAPELFGLDDFADLYLPGNPASLFELKEYQRWNQLREMTDARFLGLCLPRILLRQPWSRLDCARTGLSFEEQFDEGTRALCWGHASFAFAAVLIREFSRFNWFSHIRGAPRDTIGGGVVDQFPDSDALSEADLPFTFNTEVCISPTMEKHLAELGFIALCQSYASRQNIFLSNPSLQKSSAYQDRLASANAHVSAMMQQILCASRFAHYIKVMIRDKVGAFVTEQACQQMLENWLSRYTSGRPDMDWESRARYPLKAFRVRVFELPQSPGTYSCTISLQPHYHAEHILSELQLTTKLVQLAKAS